MERDPPIEFGVLNQVHLSHTTGADLLDDPVVPDYGVFPELNVRTGYVVMVAVLRHFRHPALGGPLTAR